MNDYAILWRDFEETPWVVVQNRVDEIEASASGHPEDPDTWAIGYEGETVLGKLLSDVDGESAHLLMQVQWTAIDSTARYHRNHKYFDPDMEVLQAVLVGPDATVFILDNPSDQIDPKNTWQEVFLDDQPFLVEEALDDAGDNLFYEVE